MPTPPPAPYLETETLDHLARMHTELLSELWILRDRVMVLEKLLEEKGTVAREEIDRYVPQGAFEQEIETERAALIRRVVGAPWKQDYTVESLIENKGR